MWQIKLNHNIYLIFILGGTIWGPSMKVQGTYCYCRHYYYSVAGKAFLRDLHTSDLAKIVKFCSDWDQALLAGSMAPSNICLGLGWDKGSSSNLVELFVSSQKNILNFFLIFLADRKSVILDFVQPFHFTNLRTLGCRKALETLHPCLNSNVSQLISQSGLDVARQLYSAP